MSRPCLAASSAALFLLLSPALSAASPQKYRLWTPDLLTLTQTGPMTLEILVADPVASASFVHNQAEAPRPLRDDGQSGDRVAGDRIFTIRFTAAELQAWYAPFARFRHRELAIGTLRFLDAAGTSAGIVTLNLPVKSDAVPRVPLTQLAANAQYSPHVFNVSMPLSYFLNGATNAPTQTFYNYFRDSFEFVALVFDGGPSQSTTFTIQQEWISGLGRALFPLSPTSGSAAKLEGVLNLARLAAMDTTSACGELVLHELGHRWINKLQGKLDDPHGSHWPLGTLAGGIMGYSAHDGTGNGGGTSPGGEFVPDGNDLKLAFNRTCAVYNDMDLYLMGFRNPNAVAPQLVAVDQNQPVPTTSERIIGPFQTVTAQDAIAANGPRGPSYVTAPRQFRIATILVTPGRLASPDLMHWVESQAVYLDSIFYDATRRSGRLRSEIASARILPPTLSPRIVNVRNAASLIAGPVSPGSIIRIEGSRLGPAVEVNVRPAFNVPGPTELASTRVTINGQAAVLLSAGSDEVTAIVPSGLPLALKSAAIQVERVLSAGTLRSNTYTLPLAAVSPAVYARHGLGAGAALAFNQNGTANTAANPALAFTTAEIVVNGAGAFTIPLPDGSLVPNSAAPTPLASPVEVFINGEAAPVVAATNIPGQLANRARIRFTVPVSADRFLNQSVFVRIGGVVSPASVYLFSENPANP